MCPVINNKYHCQFTLYFILHSAFSYKLSVFKLAAEYRNICPQLVAKYLHIVLSKTTYMEMYGLYIVQLPGV